MSPNLVTEFKKFFHIKSYSYPREIKAYVHIIELSLMICKLKCIEVYWCLYTKRKMYWKEIEDLIHDKYNEMLIIESRWLIINGCSPHNSFNFSGFKNYLNKMVCWEKYTAVSLPSLSSIHLVTHIHSYHKSS